MSTKVEIYTWKFCPFCIRAKGLLNKKGVNFQEYAIDGDDEAREAMSARAAGRRDSRRAADKDLRVSDDLLAARAQHDGIELCARRAGG